MLVDYVTKSGDQIRNKIKQVFNVVPVFRCKDIDTDHSHGHGSSESTQFILFAPQSADGDTG
jgi:hypothetical protein